MKNNEFNVLSLFDGIGGTRLCLSNLGINPTNYFASEIDQSAISIASNNFSDIQHIGDVRDVDGTKLPTIHLITFGSPCTSISNINPNKTDITDKAGESNLFFEAVRILEELRTKNPDILIIMENVSSMTQHNKQVITDTLGIEPIEFNSSLVSAQQRARTYWTNIPNVEAPANKKIKFQDILVDGYAYKDKANCVTTRQLAYTRKGLFRFLFKSIGNVVICDEHSSTDTKADIMNTYDELTMDDIITENKRYLFRLPYIVELERLQGLPDGYTEGVSKTARIKGIGNGFNIPSVQHILSFIDLS